MGWSFRKSKSFGPFRINVSKSGVGASAGGKGFRTGINSRGKTYTSTSLPGTGLRSRSYHGGEKQTATTKGNGSGAKTLLVIAAIIFGVLIPPLGVLMLIGWLIYRNQAKPKARRLSKKALDVLESDPAQARVLLQEAHELDPENDLILAAAGQAAHQAGNYEMAKRYLQEADRRDAITEHERLMLGHALYQEGEHEEAIKVVQQIPADTPEHTKAVLIAGGAFSAMEDYESAISALRQGPIRKRKLDNDLKELHYQLGMIYGQIDEKKKAERHLQRVYSTDIGYRDVKQLLNELRKEERKSH